MWESPRSCDQPGALLNFQRHLVNVLHHFLRIASAVGENHVRVAPIEGKHVALLAIEFRCQPLLPLKDLLILFSVDLAQVGLVDRLEFDGERLKRPKNLDAPTLIKLVDQSAGKDSLACAVAQIDEGTARHIERIMPAVRILIFVRPLDPLEDLEKGVELELTVRERRIS